MPVTCEYAAPFLPNMRQEIMQNQRQKDRKLPNKREVHVVLRAPRGGGKLIPKLSMFYNTVVWLKNRVPP